MPRVTLIVVVEGQSENGFLKPLLAEHLALAGIDLHLPIIGKGGSKGGMLRSFAEVCSELARFLDDRREPWVTTFFDYYGLPTGSRGGWDFVPQAKARSGAEGIESALTEGVKERAPRRADRFIPYIQMHELEALFYAEPEVLAETLGDPKLATKFQEITATSGGPEAINDSPETAPSKRLGRLFPGYKKGRSSAAHAPRLGSKLSLAQLRETCPRFNRWLRRLEALATTGASE